MYHLPYSAVKVSRDGKYIASAEQSFPGQVAEVVVWDFATREVRHKFKLHKNSVTSLAFSPDSKLLASQGCLEDKNMLVIWDVESGKSLYGTPNKEVVNEVIFFNNDSAKLIAVLQNGIQILSIDPVYKKILALNANFGNVKRHFTCAAVDHNDGYVYCGTKTGDVFEVNIDKAIYKRVGPVKKLFSLGISCIKILPNGDLIVGTG
jgi:WD40 repeat protein